MGSIGDDENRALAYEDFWNKRYATSDGEHPTHEWFRSYDDLLPFLEQQLFEPFKPTDNPKILHLGAGDSVSMKELSNDFFLMPIFDRPSRGTCWTTGTETRYAWISHLSL